MKNLYIMGWLSLGGTAWPAGVTLMVAMDKVSKVPSYIVFQKTLYCVATQIVSLHNERLMLM